MTLEELLEKVRTAAETGEDAGEIRSNIFDTLPAIRAYGDEKDAEIATRDAAIAERDAIIVDRDARIKDLEEKRARLLEEKGTYIDSLIKEKNGEEVEEEVETTSFADFVR